MSDQGQIPFNGKHYTNETPEELQQWNKDYTVVSRENVRNGIIGVATVLSLIFGTGPAYNAITKVFFKNEPQKMTPVAKNEYELDDTRGIDKKTKFVLFQNSKDSVEAAKTGEVIGTLVENYGTEAVLKLYKADDKKNYTKMDQLHVLQ